MKKILLKEISSRFITYLFIIITILLGYLFLKNKYLNYNFGILTETKIVVKEKIEHKFKTKYKDKYIPTTFVYEKLPDGSWKLNKDLSSYPKDLFIDHEVNYSKTFDFLAPINFGYSYNKNFIVGYNLNIYKNINAGLSTNFENLFINSGYKFRNISANIGINPFDGTITGYLSIYPF